MKNLFALVFVGVAAGASAQTVIQLPIASQMNEDIAFERCATSMNMVGNRHVEAEVPKVRALQKSGDYIFRWKTAAGYMNCQISMKKRGRLKIFPSSE